MRSIKLATNKIALICGCGEFRVPKDISISAAIQLAMEHCETECHTIQISGEIRPSDQRIQRKRQEDMVKNQRKAQVPHSYPYIDNGIHSANKQSSTPAVKQLSTPAVKQSSPSVKQSTSTFDSRDFDSFRKRLAARLP